MRPKLYLWLAAFFMVLSLQAQTNVVPTRPLTLKQAVQLALENNFDITISRYEPQLEAYKLGADYGYYDPEFSTEAFHTFDAEEGSFDPVTGIQSPAGTGREEDIIESRLRGILWPTGLRYELATDYHHRYGETERTVRTVDPRGGGAPQVTKDFVPFDQYSTAFNITLEQPLLRDFWIDQGRLGIKLRRKDVRISEFQLLDTVQTIVRDVEQTYYRLIAARDSAGAWQNSVDIAQKLLGDVRARIDAGVLATLDDKQVESEIELRQTELLKVQRTAVTEENRLKNLISNQSQQWHNVRLVPQEKLLALPQTYDLQESWLSGLNNRPDFNRLKEELERQGLIVKYDYNQLFPYLSLVGTYGRRGFDELAYREDTHVEHVFTPSGLVTNDVTVLRQARDARYSRALHEVGTEENLEYTYGMVFRFPLTFRKERYNFKGSKALEQQLTARVQQKQQEVMIQIQDAMQGADLAFSRVQTARKGRELAEAALNAERQKLDNARSTPFAVLRLQRDLRDLRLEEITAVQDYNISLAELQYREGRNLEKKGVNVEISNK